MAERGVNHELRAALDELRQVLDVDTPLPAVTGRSRRRLRPAAIGLAVIALAAPVFLLVIGLSPGSIESIVTGSPSARPAPPRPAVPAPEADQAGSEVQVATDADGVHLDVSERLQLDAPSGDALTLTVPDLPVLGAEARVDGLEVRLGDVAVPVVPAGSGVWTATPPAGLVWTSATLGYRVTGGVTTVTPAPPGRALGIVAPLTASISIGHGHPVQVRATGHQVLGITCPTASRGGVCGVRDAAGWTANVPDGTRPVVVLLQLDTST